MSAGRITGAIQLVRRVALALGVALLPASPAGAQAGWTGPTDLSGPDAYGWPVVGVDADGNALAVWNGATGIQAARYTSASGTWSSPDVVNTDSLAVLDLSVHPGGNAILTWGLVNDTDSVVGARAALYRADTATWSSPTEFAQNGHLVGGVIDGDGNAMVVWLEWNGIEDFSGANWVIKTAYYRQGAATWSTVSDVSNADGIYEAGLALDSNDSAILVWNGPDGFTRVERFIRGVASWSRSATIPGVGSTNIAVDRSGNATIVWTRLQSGAAASIHATHYVASTGSWSSPTSLSVGAHGTRNISPPSMASDDAGNTIAAWEWFDGVQWTIQSATYSAASHSWSSGVVGAAVPPNPARFPSSPIVRVDAAGNATVVWSDPSIRSVEAARRTAAGSWSRYTLAPSGTFSPTAAVDAAGNAIVVWTATHFPQSIIRSARWQAIPAAGLAPPSELTVVSIAGNDVTLRWLPPAGSVAATGYVLEGGDTPGSVLGSLPIQGPASTVTFPAPTGSFFVRLHATVDGVRSLPSNEIVIRVGVPLAPSAPTGLLGLADGSTLSLVWQNPSTGGAPTGIILDVTGSLTDSFQLPLSERFTFAGVPAGTYNLAVRAFNTGGISGPSNTVTLTFPGACSPPSTPTNFSAFATGNWIVASWSPPASGAAPTEYVVDMFEAFNGSFRTTGLTWSGAFEQGNYVLRVRAINACGSSAPTPTTTVTVCTSPSGEGCWDYLRPHH